MITKAPGVHMGNDKHPWYIDRGCPMPRPRSFSLSAVPNRYVAWNELTQVSTVGVGGSSSGAMCQPINSAPLSAPPPYRRAKVKGQTRWLLIVFLCIVLAALLSFLIFFFLTNQSTANVIGSHRVERTEPSSYYHPTPSGVHANPVPVPPGFQNNLWPKHPYDPSHVPDSRQNVPAFQNSGPPPYRQAQDHPPQRMEHRRSVPGFPEPPRVFVPEPSSRQQQAPPPREPVRRSPDPLRTKPPQRTDPPYPQQRTAQRTESPKRPTVSEPLKTRKEERAKARKNAMNRTEADYESGNENATESDYFKAGNLNSTTLDLNSTGNANQTYKLVIEAPQNPFQEYFFASDGTFFIVSHEDSDDVTLEVLVDG